MDEPILIVAALVLADPFEHEVGLIARGTPDANALDLRALDGFAEIVVVPFEHSLAASGATKYEDVLRLAGYVDHHFVHIGQMCVVVRARLIISAKELIYSANFVLGWGAEASA